jgi:TonB family protein
MGNETHINKRKNYFLYVLASIAAHLIFFFVIATYSDFLFMSELHRLLDHKIVDKTKDLTTQIELVDDEDRKQIVEQNTKSVNDVEPIKSDFLSAQNQSVDKQTKARDTGKFRNGSEQPNVVKQDQGAAMTSAVNVLLTPQETVSDARTTDEKLGLTGFKPSMNKNLILKRAFNTNKSVAANMQQSSDASGPSQTDDYLEDVEEGDRTLLNTKRFLYYSFYSRVKDQLRSNWNPLIREEVSFIYATNRSLSSLGKKKTSLKVTLNQSGYLEEIALLRTSGNKAIDAAAIQAFRLSAPFPNPPVEMLEKDKKIRILWDFVLET